MSATLPIPTPYSEISSISTSSLRPSPLNFSRPRPGGRGKSQHSFVLGGNQGGYGRNSGDGGARRSADVGGGGWKWDREQSRDEGVGEVKKRPSTSDGTVPLVVPLRERRRSSVDTVDLTQDVSVARGGVQMRWKGYGDRGDGDGDGGGNADDGIEDGAVRNSADTYDLDLDLALPPAIPPRGPRHATQGLADEHIQNLYANTDLEDASDTETETETETETDKDSLPAARVDSYDPIDVPPSFLPRLTRLPPDPRRPSLESFDSAAPPPIRSLPSQSTFGSSSIRGRRPSIESFDSVAPPPISTVRTHSSSQVNLNLRSPGQSKIPSTPAWGGNGKSKDKGKGKGKGKETARSMQPDYTAPTPQTWIYRPYFLSDSAASTTSLDSQATTTTHETQHTHHTADSLESGHTADTEAADGDGDADADTASLSNSSMSDFAFDGQWGWNPRRPAEGARTADASRQRWSNPQNVLHTPGAVPAPLAVHGGVPGGARRVDGGAKRTGTGEGDGEKEVVTVDGGEGVAGAGGVPRLGRTGNGSGAVGTRKGMKVLKKVASNTSADSNGTNTSNHSQTSSTNQNPDSTTRTTAPAPPPKHPRIIKRTSFSQMSEHIDLFSSTQTSTSLSDSGSGSLSSGSKEWRASDADTSGLSVEQIHKLRKKGINPALWAEMQAAKKGGKKGARARVGVLGGNAFIG